jgi:hypothetical protein
MAFDPVTAGIETAGSLGGAALGGKAAKQAAKYQMQATDKALNFQREQEAARKANYEKAYAMWLNSRNQLLQRYGLPTQGMPAAPPPAGGPPQGPAPQPMMAAVRPQVGQNIGEMLASGQEAPDWLPELPGMRRG